jgi:diketogulonate reductase-like aldo/keto reductase
MNRRQVLALAPALLGATSQGAARRPLARSGESLPVIGMGTWITFDVGSDAGEVAQRQQVLQRFFAAGGGMIDSSPMYGHAQWLLGQLLPSVPHEGKLWAATKVWTPFDRLGADQIEESLKLWGVPRFDVLLVHNLLNWRAHLKTLRQWKEAGRVRTIGISTSHGRAHDEAERVIRNETLDVLQITYNLSDASAERVMSVAAERGMGVVINRPFDGGDLFGRVRGRALPAWAGEIECANWAQFFLKWVVSHPAVTCAIPATHQPQHMDQNMAAGLGTLPDAAQRRRMQAWLTQL